SSHERQISEILQAKYPHLEVIRGSEVSGELNFLRRIVTTYHTAVTKEKWAAFAASIKDALQKRGINSPINIL
ncbi:MAG: hydantoinase/oxoprolinase family protein, partial [Firmicutes bacterium]|nr:hydantoinase/oxoprolinase family protein [Bacillota bacterium]